VRAYLGKSLSQPAMQAIWRHNLACAVIAEKLAASGPMDKDIAFTSGVMHDIGRLALSAIRPREYTDLLESHRGSAESILESEQAMFGFDHCQAGRQLIADWRLPPAFESVVAEHHADSLKGKEWNMTGLINLSCRLADAAGFAAFAGCEAAGYDDLMSELPARERSVFPASLELLASEVGDKIKAVESA